MEYYVDHVLDAGSRDEHDDVCKWLHNLGFTKAGVMSAVSAWVGAALPSVASRHWSCVALGSLAWAQVVKEGSHVAAGPAHHASQARPTFRQGRVWGGTPLDQVKSALQKGARRGEVDLVVRMALVATLIPDMCAPERPGSGGKAVMTNIVNRLVITFVEDVGLGAIHLWPRIVRLAAAVDSARNTRVGLCPPRLVSGNTMGKAKVRLDWIVARHEERVALMRLAWSVGAAAPRARACSHWKAAWITVRECAPLREAVRRAFPALEHMHQAVDQVEAALKTGTGNTGALRMRGRAALAACGVAGASKRVKGDVSLMEALTGLLCDALASASSIAFWWAERWVGATAGLVSNKWNRSRKGEWAILQLLQWWAQKHKVPGLASTSWTRLVDAARLSYTRLQGCAEGALCWRLPVILCLTQVQEQQRPPQQPASLQPPAHQPCGSSSMEERGAAGAAPHGVRLSRSQASDKVGAIMRDLMGASAQESPLRIPDWAVDMHTRAGRGVGRNQRHFALVGCAVEDELASEANSLYKRVYITSKLVAVDGVELWWSKHGQSIDGVPCGTEASTSPKKREKTPSVASPLTQPRVVIDLTSKPQSAPGQGVHAAQPTETDMLRLDARAQLTCAGSRPDTYFAWLCEGEAKATVRVFVKGPCDPATAWIPVWLNEAKKAVFGPEVTPVARMEVRELVPNRWPDGVGLGRRNKVQRLGNGSAALPAQPFLVCDDVWWPEVPSLPRMQRTSKAWSEPVTVVDWDAVAFAVGGQGPGPGAWHPLHVLQHALKGRLEASLVEEREHASLVPWVLALLYRWIMGIPDTAIRNFVWVPSRGVIVSVDESQVGRGQAHWGRMVSKRIRALLAQWCALRWEKAVGPVVRRWLNRWTQQAGWAEEKLGDDVSTQVRHRLASLLQWSKAQACMGTV